MPHRPAQFFFRHLNFLYSGTLLSKLVQQEELSQLFDKYGQRIINNFILITGCAFIAHWSNFKKITEVLVLLIEGLKRIFVLAISI